MASFNPLAACCLWMTRAKGISRERARTLLALAHDPEALFQEGPGILPNLSPEEHLSLLEAHDKHAILEALNQVQHMGMVLLLPGAPDYPERLLDLEDPPLMLYAKGNLSLLKHPRPLALVGTRRPTAYGLKVTARLAEAAAQHGAMIVSGLAVGIDALAHQTALEQEAPTVAVMGCGLDVNYPSANAHLRRKICDSGQGLLISEKPPGTPAYPGFFPDRNRLISGLSTGIVVVEAVIKSGTMSTALHGIQQGREVFAVPGNIDAPQSAGTNFLIQNMAQMLTTPEDLFFRLQWLAPKKKKPRVSPEAGKLLGLVERYGDLTIDDFIEATGWPAAKVYEFLSELEIKRLIRSWFGRYNLN